MTCCATEFISLESSCFFLSFRVRTCRLPINCLFHNMQLVHTLQIFSFLCCVGADAVFSTPSSIAHVEPRTSTYSPLTTTQRDLPAKRADNDELIGSRTSDGKRVTSSCREGSTFAISSTFAGCIAPGEEVATTCAPNHQDTDSAIVGRELWCTGWCFTQNRIYTAPSVNPFIMMNCFGDYKLSRYIEATLTPMDSAATSAGIATGGTTPPATTRSKNTPTQSPPNPQDIVEDKGLSRNDIIAIGTSVPVGVLTLIGTIATVWMCCMKRKKR